MRSSTPSPSSHHACFFGVQFPRGSLLVPIAQEVLDFVKQHSKPKPAAAAAAAAPAKAPAKLPQMVPGGVTLFFSEDEFDAGGCGCSLQRGVALCSEEKSMRVGVLGMVGVMWVGVLSVLGVLGMVSVMRFFTNEEEFDAGGCAVFVFKQEGVRCGWA